jgi:hypothetical protein
MADYDPTPLKNYVEGARRAWTEGGPDPNAPRVPDANYGGTGFDAGLPQRAEGSGETYDEPEVDEAAEGEEFDAGDEEPTATEAWEALSDEEQQAVINDPTASAQWAEALDAEQGDEGEEPEVGGIVVESPHDLVVAMLEVGGVELDDGEVIGAVEWLEWAATAPAGEWADACAATGWPVALRPGYSDLPEELRVAHHRDGLTSRAEQIAAAIEARKLDPTKTIPYL